jgi:hypothetical protein
MSFVLELVPAVGVRVALFSTYSAAIFALRMHVPKMVQDGIIDETGKSKEKNPQKKKSILKACIMFSLETQAVKIKEMAYVCRECEKE